MMNHTDGAHEVQILRQTLPENQLVFPVNYNGQQENFYLINEIVYGGNHYAIMRREKDHPDDVHLFRIHQGAFVEIEDDNEWENIAEAVDEMLYFHD